MFGTSLLPGLSPRKKRSPVRGGSGRRERATGRAAADDKTPLSVTIRMYQAFEEEECRRVHHLLEGFLYSYLRRVGQWAESTAESAQDVPMLVRSALHQHKRDREEAITRGGAAATCDTSRFLLQHYREMPTAARDEKLLLQSISRYAGIHETLRRYVVGGTAAAAAAGGAPLALPAIPQHILGEDDLAAFLLDVFVSMAHDIFLNPLLICSTDAATDEQMNRRYRRIQRLSRRHVALALADVDIRRAVAETSAVSSPLPTFGGLHTAGLGAAAAAGSGAGAGLPHLSTLAHYPDLLGRRSPVVPAPAAQALAPGGGGGGGGGSKGGETKRGGSGRANSSGSESEGDSDSGSGSGSGSDSESDVSESEGAGANAARQKQPVGRADSGSGSDDDGDDDDDDKDERSTARAKTSPGKAPARKSPDYFSFPASQRTPAKSKTPTEPAAQGRGGKTPQQSITDWLRKNPASAYRAPPPGLTPKKTPKKTPPSRY